MTATLMAREAAEAPAVAARLAADPAFAALGALLRERRPRFAVTCARGSSDHACGYGKHLIESALGLPVASVGPSIASVYGRRLALAESVFFAVSQSGRSPDLLRLTESARAAGATVVGLVNDLDSPLPGLCEVVLPLQAGPERSVAATKSCLAAMAAFLHLVAAWSDEDRLHRQVAGLPAALTAAAACDWLPGLADLAGASSLYIVGRGPGFPAAQEMALKCKETARLHAEAFSAAEVAHGPMALVGPGFPVIVLTQDDAALPQTLEVAARMAGLGASVRVVSAGKEGVGKEGWGFAPDPTRSGTRLRVTGRSSPGPLGIGAPIPRGPGDDCPVTRSRVPDLVGSGAKPQPSLPTPSLPAETTPLACLQSFYLAIERIARRRGLDPDHPPHLRKVTETL